MTTVTAGVTVAVTEPVTLIEPTVRLRARGKRLWHALTVDGEPPALELPMVEELCRMVDRLDRFDAIVNGRDRAWLQLDFGDLGEVEVTVDKVLGEARQQQATFKALLAELRQLRAASAPARSSSKAPPAAAAPAGGGSVGGVTDLAARIAAKRSGQASG